MQAIRNVVGRFFSIQSLLTITQALRRRLQPQPTEPSTSSEPATDIPPQRADAEDADPEEAFAAWETERAEKLHQAEQYEQQGVRQLAQAALLRASVKCDDRGETFIAQELRELADDAPIPEPVPAGAWDRPILRVIAADDTPLDRGTDLGRSSTPIEIPKQERQVSLD